MVPEPTGHATEGVAALQPFGTMPRELLARADWLAAARIPHVALESPGEDWQPGDNLLQGACAVWLGHASPVKHGPGRKTDQAAARWLAKRMRGGLLPASGMPPAGQRDVRDRTRYRPTVVQERAREVNRVQGVLARAKSTLAAVVSDIMGGSGRAMLEALLAGRAKPATMAALAQSRLRSPLPLLEQALPGGVRAHHRRLLSIQLAHLDCLDAPSEARNTAIAAALEALRSDEARNPTPPSAATSDSVTPQETAPSVPFLRAVERLDPIPGVDRRGAARVIAEIGVDMARCGAAPRLAAWAGVAPGHEERAGQQRSGTTRQGTPPLRAVLTPRAHAAVRPTGTYCSAWYPRLAARRGKQRAILAVAHAIMGSVWHMLVRHAPYHELEANSFDERRRHDPVDRLARRLECLGYRVHLEPLPAATG